MGEIIVSKKKIVGIIASSIVGGTAIVTWIMKKKAKKTTYKAESIEAIPTRKMGFYEKYVKRAIDVVCASAAIICFSPLYIGVAILVKFKLGSPVLFTQDRPGLIGEDGKETIFKMYKFRTMTDERDENGELLPDEVRLTSFGKWLRSTSLDELPEAFNILNGTLSICGPRPQLVRDLTFMTKEQRMRHTAKPGLSGLAQVNGRNAIKWEDKLNWDLKYIENVTLLKDFSIILKTVKTAFIKQEGITDGDMATAEDFGDYLLKNEKITSEEYDKKQIEAKQILNKCDGILREENMVSIIMPSYNTASYIKESIQSVLNQTYTNWELIIVDDCSSDNTVKIVQEISKKDPRVRILKQNTNGGAAKARNRSLNEATGRYVAYLDADDIWKPSKLEKQIQFMNEHKCGFSCASYEVIDDEGNTLNKEVHMLPSVDYVGFLTNNLLQTVGIMVDTSIVDKKYLVMPDIRRRQDAATWLQVLKAGYKCYGLDEVLAEYRRAENSLSSNKIKAVKGVWSLYRDIEKLSLPFSCYCFVRYAFLAVWKRIYIKGN